MKKIRVRKSDGTIVIVDLEKCKCIYEDGAWSSRGVDVYVTPKKKLICIPWSKWQGDDPYASFISVSEFLKYPHFSRVETGLEIAEIDLPCEEV